MHTPGGHSPDQVHSPDQIYIYSRDAQTQYHLQYKDINIFNALFSF